MSEPSRVIRLLVENVGEKFSIEHVDTLPLGTKVGWVELFFAKFPCFFEPCFPIFVSHKVPNCNFQPEYPRKLYPLMRRSLSAKIKKRSLFVKARSW